MKTALVSHSYPTLSDPSSGIFIQKEAHLLTAFSDVEVFIPTVYATPLNKQYYRDNRLVQESFPLHMFKYLSIPRRRLPSITQRHISFKLLKKLDNLNLDIVHLHALYPSGITSKFLKNAGYNVVITIHGGDWYSIQNNKTLLSIVHEAMLTADRIIAVGKVLRKNIVDRFPDLSQKIFHIPNSIDTTKFKPGASKLEVKLHLGWKPSKTHLLTVANLYKVKGVNYLIRAFAKFQSLENLHLHLIAPRFHAEVKSELLQLISEFKLEQNITFYPSMPEEKIIPYYQAADLFVSPSVKEGFGLAIAEAAACGTPILATKSGGPEEIVNEKIGKLVDSKNSQALSEGIKEMLSDLKKYNQQELNNYISSKFGVKKKQNKLKEIYTSIIN